MIKLKRPNQEEFYLNPFHIEKMEVSNYTVITLTNQKKYIVKNTVEEVRNEVMLFWKRAFNLSEKADISR